jgi:hypothetical protein
LERVEKLMEVMEEIKAGQLTELTSLRVDEDGLKT